VIRILLLGEPILLKDDPDGPLPISRWQMGLLALLARSRGATATRSSLAATLWPDSSDEGARLSLRQALFRLRRSVGEIVSTGGDAVWLDPARVSVDANRFEELVAAGEPGPALELYRGEFLAGFSLPGSAVFGHWADRERAHLVVQAARAFELRIDESTRRGEWRAALEWAVRWCETEPFSEAAFRRRVALLAQEGDRGSALAAYEAFRCRLEQEMGIRPGADLESLMVRIRGASSRLTPPRPASGEVPATPAEPPLVGRASEFTRMVARWERAREGRCQFVLVSGEAGIGKTRLASEFGEWARLAGATVLVGRAYEVEGGSIPYAALSAALRAGLGAPGIAAVDARVLGELSRILPELSSRFAGSVVAPTDDPELGRLRLLEAVGTLFDNLLYEAPVALLLDDLPWVDAASITVLHYLWRTLGSTPLLVLGTARAGEMVPGSAAGKFLGALLREHAADVEQLDLAPLGRAEIARIVDAMVEASGELGSAVLPELLEDKTGGNPLLIVEVLRSLSEGAGEIAPTTTIVAVVQDRLGRLSPGARHLLSAAAVLGRRFPLPTAAAIADLPHGEVTSALEQLLAARIVQQVHYGYDFAHDLVRQIVYTGLSIPRRVLLHRRAFERLQPVEVDEAVGHERAGALAFHAGHGGLREASFRWLLRAAGLATEAYAESEAEAYLDQAERLAETDEERRVIWERIGDFRRVRSRFVDAGRAYLEALSHARSGTAERLRLRIRALDTSVRAGLLQTSEIDALARDLVPEATDSGGAPLRDLHAALAHAHVQAGELRAAFEHATAMVKAAAAVPAEPRPHVRALLLHGRLGTATGTAAHSLPVLESAARVAAEHGLATEHAQVEIERATELIRLGSWTDAAAVLEGVLTRAEAAGDQSSVATAALNLGDLLLRRGEWERAGSLLDRVETLGERFPHMHLYARINRALMAWLRGDPETMERYAAEVAARALSLAFHPIEQLARSLIVLARLERGRAPGPDDMRALQAPGSAGLPFWPVDREMILLVRARSAARTGDLSRAARILEAGLQELRDRYGAAVLRLELAAVVRLEEPARSERLLDEAITTFHELHALPLLERARASRSA
jgi:DNA-binding SARP family transcriptional activator/tetratricopeptide (TPR) repeat protein